MNSDFLTPPTNVNVKMLKLFKRALHNKIAQKGPKEAKKGPTWLKMAKGPKRVQECLTEMNSNFLTPPTNVM